jgi:ribonuclease HI
MALMNNTALVELWPEARKSLRKLARCLDLGKYDLLLVGDGSGEDYQQTAAWACTSYDPLKKRAVVHAGMLTAATNNFAELFPYLHALWFHHHEHQGEPLRGYQVAVVSDSELTVRCGNRIYRRKANLCLWEAINWFERQAYVLRWHHVRRLSNPWNKLADVLAGQVRASAADVQEAATAAVQQVLPHVLME